MSTTTEVANRLVALCREGKIKDALQELYSQHAVSIEPTDRMGPMKVEGLDNIIKKSEKFDEAVEEFHSSAISEPVIAGKLFSISWALDATFKGRGRVTMDEICVYRVEEGKIVSEQFIY